MNYPKVRGWAAHHGALRSLGRSLLGVALVAVLAGVACRPQGEVDDDGRLDVVCTTGMIADASRVIGGENVRVTGLMGPGVDPHLYIASREDQRRLKSADLVLYHGHHLEGKMADFLRGLTEQGSGAPATVAVGEAVPIERLIVNESFAEYPDPHVWFDLELWATVVERITTALAERDPPHAEGYRARGDAHLEEIRATHRWAKEEVARIPAGQRKLVTSHDAYNYFGRAYGLEVRGLQGISTETNAGLQEIRRAITFVRESAVPVIFAETSVPRNAVEQVARESGAQVCEHELFSDALGSPGTPEESFLGVFRHNVRTIVEALTDEAGGASR